MYRNQNYRGFIKVLNRRATEFDTRAKALRALPPNGFRGHASPENFGVLYSQECVFLHFEADFQQPKTSLTNVTEADGVPGSRLEREPEEYTVDQLKRRLKCRGLIKSSGKREDRVQRVRDTPLIQQSSMENGLLSKFFKKILM